MCIDESVILYVLHNLCGGVGCTHGLRVYAICDEWSLNRNDVVYEIAVCGIQQAILGYPNSYMGIYEVKSLKIEISFKELAPYIPVYPRFFETKQIEVIDICVDCITIILYVVCARILKGFIVKTN
ncbi:hypothetical protein [uncultured Helicobacter sp.]|uniref:hypothetical protein n=1 Tax=uncultured Helicobacter sp. TaxID=175537 RepID=UPI00374EC681